MPAPSASPRGGSSAAVDDQPATSGANALLGFWRERRLELLGAWLFTAWISWPFLRWSRLVTGFDTIAYSSPNAAVTNEALRHGRLPQWNGRIFGGVPHLANPQNGVFNVLKLPFLWVSPHRSVVLITAAHLFLFALGMVVLLGGRMKLRPPAAFVGTVVIMGSGLVAAKSMQYEQILVVAWTPFLLAAIDWALSDGSRPRRAIAAVGITTACVVLAGHPHIVFLSACLAVGWIVVRAIHHHTVRRLWIVATGGALGLGLSAIQLLPSALFATGSGESGGRPLQALRNPALIVHPTQLPVTLLGDVFAKNQGAVTSGEVMAFVGAAGAMLAMLGLVHGLWHRTTRLATATLAVVGGTALLLAFGPRTFLYRAAYDVVPAFNQARVPGRWVLVVVLVLAIAAAQGADAIVRRRLSRPELGIAGGLTLGVVLIAVVGPFEIPDGSVVVAWLVVGGAVLATAISTLSGRRWIGGFAAVVLCVAVVLELGFAATHSPARNEALPASVDDAHGAATDLLGHRRESSIALTGDRLGDPRYLLLGLRPNVNVMEHIRSIDGYDGGPQVTQRWMDAMRVFTDGRFNFDLTLRAQAHTPLDADRYARFGVRWALVETANLPASAVVAGWRGPVRSQGTMQLWENPRYRSGAFVYLRSRRVPDSTGLALRGLSPAELSSVALVDRHGPELRCASRCDRKIAVLRRSGSPEHLTVDTTPLSRPGLLVVSEQYDDGWHATVDGHRARVIPVDGYQLGIRVPAGRHRVKLSYTAPGLVAGAWISLLSLVTTVILLVGGHRRRRGAPSSSSAESAIVEP